MKRRRSAPDGPPGTIVVAEDHHDVLPWIHAAMRRKRVPVTDVTLIHYDAHPDLGAVNKAAVCRNPRALYDFLDASEFGIAEWILPLVFQGHVPRVVWVKPDFADQFAVGEYDLRVGEEPSSGKLAVDCAASYFVEDESYTAEPLARAAPLRLVVARDDGGLLARAPPAGAWILDVCLDYFACLDPFVHAPESNLAPRCGQLPAGGAATRDEASAAVRAFGAGLEATRANPPCLITVARSATDGYCPADLADALQADVERELRRAYGDGVVTAVDLDGTRAFLPEEIARAFPR